MARTPASPALRQLPNAITVLRILLIPVFILLVVDAESGHDLAAAIVFGIAGITDQIDGWLARRWKVESTFGTFADPLADRLMIVAAVTLLCLHDRLPWPALAVVAGRDLLLVAGTRFVVRRGYVFSVSFLGKLATWVLYAAIGLILITRPGDEWPLWVFWAGVGLAVAAAAAYVGGVVAHVRAGDPAQLGQESAPTEEI